MSEPLFLCYDKYRIEQLTGRRIYCVPQGAVFSTWHLDTTVLRSEAKQTYHEEESGQRADHFIEARTREEEQKATRIRMYPSSAYP